MVDSSARRGEYSAMRDTVTIVESPHPIDPFADQAPSIPQARQSGESAPEFGVIPPPANSDVAWPHQTDIPAPEKPAYKQSTPVNDDSPEVMVIGKPSPADAVANELPSVWNKKSISLIALAVVIVLGIAAIATTYTLYDHATQPDRGSPSLVVRQFLDATFDQRDSDKAKTLTCDGSNLSEIATSVADIIDREQRFSIHITVKWEIGIVNTHGNNSTVAATLGFQIPKEDRVVIEWLENWEFSLRDQSGWRVCQAHQIR